MRGLFFVAVALLCLWGCGGGEKNGSSGEVLFRLSDSVSVRLKTGQIKKGRDLVILNEGEDIVLTLVREGVYSVPVFGGSVYGDWGGDGSFRGVWVDSLRGAGYRVPLEARPTLLGQPCEDEKKPFVYETSLGLLVGEEYCDSVRGTILTPTGDYRYLTGTKGGGELCLNTFDGAHLFCFKARVKGDSLVGGAFFSGTHYVSDVWSGVRVSRPEVGWSSKQAPDLSSSVEILGVDPFNVLDSLGQKLLVIDILGTWCPNCYDEVRLLKSLEGLYPDVAFMSVAFERGDSASAYRRISQFKNQLGISWPILYGGPADKSHADSVVSFLGGVKSFPTTAFISSNGEVVVHTGFNGPATPYYSEEVGFYKSTIESFIE